MRMMVIAGRAQSGHLNLQFQLYNGHFIWPPLYFKHLLANSDDTYPTLQSFEQSPVTSTYEVQGFTSSAALLSLRNLKQVA